LTSGNGKVAENKQGRPLAGSSKALNALFTGIRVNVQDNRSRAFRCKALHDGPPNSLGAAGNQYGLRFKSHRTLS
jgi:hypothetical protein